MELSSHRWCPRCETSKERRITLLQLERVPSYCFDGPGRRRLQVYLGHIGANCSASDAAIFNHSEMKEVTENDTIGFPAAESLPNDDIPMPYFTIGTDAFPLRTWLKKPFSRCNLLDAIFNYRLSRGGGVVENAFSILSNRLKCLLTTMQETPTVVESFGLVCRCLHNFMRLRYLALQNAALDQEGTTVLPRLFR